MQEPQQHDTLVPPANLLAAVLQFCAAGFRPLFLTAAGMAVISATLSLFVAGRVLSPAGLFLYSMVLLGLEAVMHAAVLWVAVRVLEGKEVRPAAVITAAMAFGPRYFAGGFLLLAAVASSLFVVFLLPLAVYVAVRASLFGPAIVLENLTIVESLKRSWQLVEGRWMRTFGLESGFVGIMLLGSLLMTLLATTGVPTAVLFVVNVVTSGVILPPLMVLLLLLFRDYRRVSDRNDLRDLG